MALSYLSSFCSADLGIPSVLSSEFFSRGRLGLAPNPRRPSRSSGLPLLAVLGIAPTSPSFLTPRDSASPTFPLRSCPSASFALAALLFFHRLIHSEPAFGVTPPNCSVPREQATQSRSLLPQFGDHPGGSRGCAPPRRPDD